MSEKVKIIAMMTAAPGRMTELRSIMEEFVKATREEPGCLEFVLHQSLDHEQVLIVTELWANEASLQAHFQGPAVRKVQQADMGSLVASSQIHHLRAVA